MIAEANGLSKALAPPAITALLLLIGAVWVLVRPYDGLVSDAQVYALQALATLKPGVIAGDIFLRYGSQNDFTIFPRLYALAAQAIGFERTAAALTLLFSCLWLALGWLIARQLSSRDMAWLALGLLIAVKAWYGAYHVFRAGEMFLSARLPAECLSLAAIAAYLGGRRALAGALVLVSGMLHPLMALPVTVLLCFMFAEERWAGVSLRILLPMLLFAGTAATLLLSGDRATYTDEWMAALRARSIFLFPVNWRFEDWQHHALVLATLCLGSAIATSRTFARFAGSTAVLGLAGLGLAVISGALAHYPALLKIQPWRWFWPVVVAAIIVLPTTVRELWRADDVPGRRTCSILLLASWLTMDSYGGLLAVACLGIFWSGSHASRRASYALRAGAWLILAATILSAAVAAWQCASYPFDTNLEPRWMQRLANALPTNSAAVAAILGCWIVAVLAGRSRALAALGVASAAALLVLLIPRAERTWTTEYYPPDVYSAFAPWRAIMPPTAEVLWPANPTRVWLLLERRSYMSNGQLAGLLYSPKMTAELTRRTTALAPLASPGWWTSASESKDAAPKKLTPALLGQVCRAPALDYVVDDTKLEGSIGTVVLPLERVPVYLYDCHAINAARPGT
jgi:hypothetical protein